MLLTVNLFDKTAQQGEETVAGHHLYILQTTAATPRQKIVKSPKCPLPCLAVTLRQGCSKEQQNVAFMTGIEETFYMGKSSSEHSSNL